MSKIYTYYDDLKISRDAPNEVIRAAYKSLSLKYHPDRYHNSEATEIMATINKAYEVLSDPLKRKQYDEWIEIIEKKSDDSPQSGVKPSSVVDDSTASTVNPSAGFLTKLANGDFGLAKTYWLYGVAVSIIVNLIFKTITKTITSAEFLAILLLWYTAYEILVLMGIWRATNKYRGLKVWAVLAKIAVVLGALTLVLSLAVILGVVLNSISNLTKVNELQRQDTNTQNSQFDPSRAHPLNDISADTKPPQQTYNQPLSGVTPPTVHLPKPQATEPVREECDIKSVMTDHEIEVCKAAAKEYLNTNKPVTKHGSKKH